jgi:hypothetical protein
VFVTDRFVDPYGIPGTCSSPVRSASALSISGRSNRQSILGATCFYLLIGMLFTFVYGAVAVLGLGDFRPGDGRDALAAAVLQLRDARDRLRHDFFKPV